MKRLVWIILILGWVVYSCSPGTNPSTEPSEEVQGQGDGVVSQESASEQVGKEQDSQESQGGEPAQEPVTDAGTADNNTVDSQEQGGTEPVQESPTDNASQEATDEGVADAGTEPTVESDPPEATAEMTPDTAEPVAEKVAEQPPAEKPPIGSNQCSAEQACKNGALCAYPGKFIGCGTCRNPDPNSVCTSDSQCKSAGAHYVCINKPNFCHCSGQKICTPGCQANSDCGASEICQSGNCVAKPCQANADCQTDFVCSNQKCARKTCQSTSDCNGYCVTGACYSQPGNCQFPPP